MVGRPRHFPLLGPKWAPGGSWGRFLGNGVFGQVQALERARREARARPDGLVPADDPEDEENFYFREDTSGSSEEEDMGAAPQVAAAAAVATPSDPAPRRSSRARARSRLGIALDVASLAKRCRR